MKFDFVAVDDVLTEAGKSAFFNPDWFRRSAKAGDPDCPHTVTRRPHHEPFTLDLIFNPWTCVACGAELGFDE